MINNFFQRKIVKPKIFLHIGTNKTATSTIQRYFSENLSFFSRKGLCYPIESRRDFAHYALSASLGFRHQNAPNGWIVNEKALARGLETEFKKSQTQWALFSSEDFMLNRPVSVVRDFFSSYDVKIVVYLRRHDAWWESAYAQAVKMKTMPPWPQGIHGFINFNRQKNKLYGNYRELVNRWAKVFGTENILVRPYEAQQNTPTIISDLLTTIGFFHDSLALPEVSGRENESLSVKAIRLLDIFQRVDVDEYTRKVLIDYARSLPSDTIKQTLLSPEHRCRLIEQNSNDYEYIARTYLGRCDGRLFYDELPDSNQDWTPSGQLTAMEIVEATNTAIKRAAK